MDFNFQPHMHYVFAIEDDAGRLQVETLRFAPNGRGGNVFGIEAIAESLALYGITDCPSVMAVTKQQACAWVDDQQLSVGRLDRRRFNAAENHYGPIRDIIALNHAYKVELNLPGYTVADQIRDLLPGQHYQGVGKIFGAPHLRNPHQMVKGILYTEPTLHEGVFGKTQMMQANTAVICLSSQQTYGADAYMISGPEEFEECWKPFAHGLQASPARKTRTKLTYVLPHN